MDPQVREAKRALRRELRERAPDAKALARESAEVTALIAGWEVFRRADVIAAYLPLPGETDITPLLRQILAEGRTLALPRTARDLSMTFHRAGALEALDRDAWGIPAPPADSPPIPAEEIRLMLTPLTAVDARGFRLGKGGGCYDRYLAEHPGLRAVTLGVARRGQWVPRVPAGAWDMPLRWATDPASGVIRGFAPGTRLEEETF